MKRMIEEELLNREHEGIVYGAVWSGIIKGSIAWLIVIALGLGGLIMFGNHSTYYLGKIFLGLNIGSFLLAGYLAGKAVGNHGGRHGLITGITMGVMAVMLLLESAPLVVTIPLLVGQFLLAMIGGLLGGKLANCSMAVRGSRSGYQVVRVKSGQLDRQ